MGYRHTASHSASLHVRQKETLQVTSVLSLQRTGGSVSTEADGTITTELQDIKTLSGVTKLIG